MQPYPPLGTLYAASLLRQRGFSVALFDTMLEDPRRGFPAALKRHRPRLVAIVEDNFNFLSKMCLTRMREVAFGMLDQARLAGATVVVNGFDASDHVDDFLRRGFDYALLGEPEWTLLELARGIEELPDISGAIPGLAFLRSETQEVVRTAPRPLMRRLDELPLPARDLIDIDRYRQAWKTAHGFFSLNAVVSRGCPFQCNWCAKPIYGSSFHARSPESVAEEMQELKRAYGAEHVWFADDIFALKPGWALGLAEAVEEREAALPFKIQSRIDLMIPETAQALARAGCTEVWMGVESGSQKILNAMNKSTRVEEIPMARDGLRRYGIRACFFLQFGYPGESWEDIQETIRLVRQMQPDDIGVSVAYPLPGTKFHERVREELGVKRNWVDSNDLSVMFKAAYTQEFYRALRDALHAEVETWSIPQCAPCGARRAETLSHVADAARLDCLWKTVERLEKTCRKTEPSLSSVQALAGAEPRR